MASSTPTTTPVAPIIFSARGLTPDVRLQVFDKEFHVHSTVLKLHSEYFFKFLDPLNVPPAAAPVAGSFRYEWGALGKADDCESTPREQEDAFEKILKAMYNRPFLIKDMPELAAMVKLAGYYLARPVLSSALPAALCRTPGASKMVKHFNFWALELAADLRCDVLFKQALAVSMGPFHRPIFRHLKDGPVKDLAEKKYLNLRSQVLAAYEAILTATRNAGRAQVNLDMVYSSRGAPLWPRYFRKLQYREEIMRDNIAKERIKSLLKNNLSFDEAYDSGLGDFEDYFLCVEVSDHELPWGTTETDF